MSENKSETGKNFLVQGSILAIAGVITKIIRMHGASTRKANVLIFIAIRFDAIKSAPKNMMAPTIPPAAIANVMAPRKTRYAFLYCPVASLAETSLDTARGRL